MEDDASAKKPTTAVMVQEVIRTLDEKKGSSAQAIKKVIVEKYAVAPDRIGHLINKSLKSMVEAGTLVQTSGTGATGSFKIAKPKSDKKTEKGTDEKAKKPKATGTAAVKPKKAPVSVGKKTVSKKTKAGSAPEDETTGSEDGDSDMDEHEDVIAKVQNLKLKQNSKKGPVLKKGPISKKANPGTAAAAEHDTGSEEDESATDGEIDEQVAQKLQKPKPNPKKAPTIKKGPVPKKAIPGAPKSGILPSPPVHVDNSLSDSYSDDDGSDDQLDDNIGDPQLQEPATTNSTVPKEKSKKAPAPKKVLAPKKVNKPVASKSAQPAVSSAAANESTGESADDTLLVDTDGSDEEAAAEAIKKPVAKSVKPAAAKAKQQEPAASAPATARGGKRASPKAAAVPKEKLEPKPKKSKQDTAAPSKARKPIVNKKQVSADDDSDESDSEGEDSAQVDPPAAPRGKKPANSATTLPKATTATGKAKDGPKTTKGKGPVKKVTKQ